MNSTIDPSIVNPDLLPRPQTVVLQPAGSIYPENLSQFQQTLETALEQAIEAVIVDLLWVETTSADGIAVMAAGLRQAKRLGKALSFQSLDSRTRAALELEYDRLRQQDFGTWNDVFERELESFLDNLHPG